MFLEFWILKTFVYIVLILAAPPKPNAPLHLPVKRDFGLSQSVLFTAKAGHLEISQKFLHFEKITLRKQKNKSANWVWKMVLLISF